MAARLAQCVRGLSAPKTLDMAVRNMRIYSKQPFYSVVRRRHRRRRRQVVLAVGAAAAAASWLTYNYISCIEVACDAPRGRVYLVGAGPGAADLLTLRAAKLLSQADVVVCDELIGNDVLSSCRKDATIMTMGKRGGRETSTKQNDINDVIVKLCKEGKMVVRLKGGDPLLFGRAADEIRSLAKHGCSYEIVPGITSVFAAAAEAGIPLTHKTLSSSITIATGHDPSLLDFHSLSRLETIVFVMATRTLSTIATELIDAGKSPTTPVCIVRKASFEDAQIFNTTLGTATTDVDEMSLSPSVIIIGQVAKFAEEGGQLLL